ncbi:MAG TPA: HEPN domain-containing protein [Phycisphaerae bacterium]
MSFTNECVDDWVRRAEDDLDAAKRLARVRIRAHWNNVAFHAQQCAEKYLKAFLTQHEVQFPRIHDLKALLDLAVPLAPLWDALRPICEDLSDYAVLPRYPGQDVTREEAKNALTNATVVRRRVREIMGLPAERAAPRARQRKTPRKISRKKRRGRT